MPIPSWLEFAKTPKPIIGEDATPTILVENIKQKYKIDPLTRGYFVFDDTDLWIHFAVLQWVTEYIEDGKTVIEASCVFHGEGPSGNLRECRHTYWGEDGGGYIFYPYGPLIVAAFKRMSEFFDDMA